MATPRTRWVAGLALFFVLLKAGVFMQPEWTPLFDEVYESSEARNERSASCFLAGILLTKLSAPHYRGAAVICRAPDMVTEFVVLSLGPFGVNFNDILIPT